MRVRGFFGQRRLRRRSDRGSVTVEYAALLALVAVGLCAAVAALGVPLALMFRTQQTWLLLPFP